MFEKFLTLIKKLFGFESSGQVHYIGSGEALPAPLEATDETEVINKMLEAI